MSNLRKFYRSDEWYKFSNLLKMERVDAEGMLRCEECGKPITKAYDAICHHVQELNETNANDAEVSLNPANIKIVHHACHNRIHVDKFCHDHEVFLVWGPPFAGKSSWVDGVRVAGDLVVDMDRIWNCVSLEGYNKPGRLNAVVFGLRDELFRMVEMRVGKWERAYVIGGFPLLAERERLCKRFGAREVFVECDKDTCLSRLAAADDGRGDKWYQYVDEWFRLATPRACLETAL